MTQTEARTRVRNKINQTDSTNSIYSDADFIDHELNSARRYFASILDDKYLVRLRTSSSLTVSGGVGSYPNDFLRIVSDAHVTVDSGDVAVRLKESEKWRLRYLNTTDQNLGTPNSSSRYWGYWEISAGIKTTPSATTINYEYIKNPDELGGTENTELPDTINDMCIDFAFESCMRSTRGDKALALSLAKNRGFKIKELHNGIS